MVRQGLATMSVLSCRSSDYPFGVDVEKATAPPVPGAHAPPPGISFDRFVRACVVIKTLTESFQRLDTDRDGWVQINYDQFMHTVLSAP